jgi:hypothetical protein
MANTLEIFDGLISFIARSAEYKEYKNIINRQKNHNASGIQHIDKIPSGDGSPDMGLLSEDNSNEEHKLDLYPIPYGADIKQLPTGHPFELVRILEETPPTYLQVIKTLMSFSFHQIIFMASNCVNTFLENKASIKLYNEYYYHEHLYTEYPYTDKCYEWLISEVIRNDKFDIMYLDRLPSFDLLKNLIEHKNLFNILLKKRTLREIKIVDVDYLHLIYLKLFQPSGIDDHDLEHDDIVSNIILIFENDQYKLFVPLIKK